MNPRTLLSALFFIFNKIVYITYIDKKVEIF
jgi:hypothetical protein